VDAFIAEELPFLRAYRTKVIANLSGNTVEEYANMAQKLSDAGVDMLEVNISCPNVKEGGLAFGTSAQSAAEVTRAVRAKSRVPVMVKLSPNVADIASIAKACEAEGADALSLINTLLGMRIDIQTKKPILNNNMGGLSGPAIFPVALRMVYQVAQTVHLPILGMGGILTAQDAAEMMIAGADMIALGTALFIDPLAPIKVKRELSAYLDQRGLKSVRELTGTVQVHV
jgi:dihydroorotate dehydrogenase (NAD+) catalytic subunit